MSAVYWISDGGGEGVGVVHNTFVRWIRNQGTQRLIVVGGDVYDDGTPAEFATFMQQMDGNVSDMCETAGNHDWETTSSSAATGPIPSAYEAFWRQVPPPLSRQPIDTSKRGGARYEHFIDADGWRLIFLDTGPCKESPWPMGDASRLAWLKSALDTPGRAKIVCAHHSRLSWGKHGDVKNVDTAWRALFDEAGNPRAALTLGGHDHNVSIYNPRPRDNPKNGSVAFANGIHIIVNGAGGRGHDLRFRGTRPDRFDDDRRYCVTRINLIGPLAADIDTLSFGSSKNPPPGTVPALLHTLQIRL
jgi:3',5'-cyclic AMP phosphodiesterase CpdA